MIVTLEEMKQYLRVDYPDDDAILEDIISAAERLCIAVSRVEDEEAFMESKNAKIAVMYAVAFMNRLSGRQTGLTRNLPACAITETGWK